MASLWESRVKNHTLWAVVEQLEDQLSQVPAPEDIDGRESLSRLFWLIETLKGHRANEDSRGYTPTMLDTVQRQLSGNVVVHVDQYVADTKVNVSNLRAAAEAVDTVLDQMGAWPTLSAKGAARAAGQAAKAFESASNQALDELTANAALLTGQVEKIRSQVGNERAAITKLREDFEAGSAQSVTAKLDNLTDDFHESVRQTLEAIATDQAAANESRASIANLETEGRNIVEAVANKAVAHDYRQNARNKSVAGWVWDGIGLAIGGTALTLLLVHLFDNDAPATSASLAITRLAVSIAGLGLAYLCFTRGASNHQEARRAKRADIRISTVKPFIANQDPEFQDAIVEGMADRIYLQGILDSDESKDDPSLYARARDLLRERKARMTDAAEGDAPLA